MIPYIDPTSGIEPVPNPLVLPLGMDSTDIKKRKILATERNFKTDF